MRAPLKISARVDIDSSQAKQGASAAAVAVDTIGAAAERNTTKIQKLIDASMGLGGSAANSNAREWTGALAMQGKSLDDLRAKYNPLFATISQYKAAQTEIRTLHAQGVLSADEMSAALQRHRQSALASIDAIKDRSAAMAMEAVASAALAQKTDQLRAQFDPLHAAGQRYQKVVAEIAEAERLGAISASQAIEIRQRATLAYNTEITTLERLAAARKAAAQAIVDRNTVAPDRGRDVAAYGDQLDALRAKYNPLYATIVQYKAAQAEIRQAHAVGAISADEMTAAIQRQRQATLASIDAIKGRNQVMSGNGVGHNYAATNAMFQFQDIAMTAAMGMSPAMIGLQQGSQLAGGFAGMNFKEAAATTSSALAGLVSPVSLVAIGLTTAAAAAIQFGAGMFSSETAAEKLDTALERHSKTVEQLAQRWGDVLQNSSQYGQRSSAALGFSVEMSTAQLRDSLRKQVPDVLTSITGSTSDNIDEIGGARKFRQDPLYGLLTEEVTRLVEAAKTGSPDIVGLSRRIAELANTSSNGAVRKLADDIILAIGPVEELARRLQEAERNKVRLFNSVGPNGMLLSRGAIAQQDGTNSTLFESRERVAADRSRAAYEAEIYGLNARSPRERAEAARRSAAAQYQDNETAPARRLRVEQAGTLALTQAEKELADAQRDRRRSLDDTLAQQQLEISLIGQTVGEQERLRMQYRLTSELQAEADRTGTKVNSAELERVKALSAEYGRLAEQMTARRALDDQDRELSALQTRLALTGKNEEARARAIINLETERRLREMGIALGSREADQYREKARLIGEQTENLRKQEAAWDKIRSTAEDTIDSIVDKAIDGDFSGMLEDIAKDWSKSLLTLGVSNPLKNGLLGTNHETMDDIGGLGGMFSKLFGGGGMSTGAMSVTAATVNVNGGVAGGVASLLGKPANDNATIAGAFKAAGTTKTGIALSEVMAGNGMTAKVASDYAPRFQGLLNDLKAAGYNISSLGEGGYSYRNVAGSGNLSKHAFGEAIDINPRQNPWSNTFKTDLPPNINEMAQKNGLLWGGNWNKPDTMHFQVDKTINTAALSLQRVATSADATTQGLGTLGNGFDKFGSALSSVQPGGSTSGGGGFLSSLLGMFSPQYKIATSGGVGLFAKGGIADRPSIFGEAGTEAAVPLPDGRTIPVTLNVRQAYRSPMAGTTPDSSGRNAPIINNYGNNAVEYEEQTDEHGNRQPVITIGEPVAAALRQRGNPARQALQSEFGLRSRRIQR